MNQIKIEVQKIYLVYPNKIEYHVYEDGELIARYKWRHKAKRHAKRIKKFRESNIWLEYEPKK